MIFLQICVLVYDVTNIQTFNALDDWIKEFETFGGKGAMMFAVGNKVSSLMYDNKPVGSGGLGESQ